MKISLYMVLPLLVGGIVVLQGIINAKLGLLVGGSMQATFVSFIVGTLAITMVFLISGLKLPSIAALQTVPPILYLGGILGVIYVLSVIWLLPKQGAGTVVLGLFAGQIIVSMVIDSVGIAGLPQKDLSLVRVLGITFMVSGLILINYENQ